MIITKYRNGNYDVSIYENGTKIREFDEAPEPIYPESMDIKITNYCDAGCAFCHEKSTKEGLHGNFSFTNKMDLLYQLPEGVELAIGGGNPLSHPDLMYFLSTARLCGLISNITVNHFHLETYKHLIENLIAREYIRGLGISYLKHIKTDLKPFINDNTVIHLIIGVHTTQDLRELVNKYGKLKVLLLGYKNFGRGEQYYAVLSERVKKNIADWYINIFQFFKEEGLTISFDNLAILQLNARRFFSEEDWQKFYMGDDGKFTMYMDFVKDEYAVSSTSKERYRLDSQPSMAEIFKHIRNGHEKKI